MFSTGGVMEVVWYDAALLKMNQGEIYSHKDIVGLLSQEKPGLGRSGYHWAIDKLLQKGELERKGYGIYSVSDGRKLRSFSPSYSEEAQLLMKTLSEKYPYVSFTVFETVLMNNFLNHLIGQNTNFLQVERDSSIYVFRFFQEESQNNVLYKPNKKEFSLYWDTGTTVITDLISEAPMRNDKPHYVMLEKMLVDMCADKLIASTFSKAEMPDIFEQAMTRYVLDIPRMLRYARRRHKEEVIKKYIRGEK